MRIASFETETAQVFGFDATGLCCSISCFATFVRAEQQPTAQRSHDFGIARESEQDEDSLQRAECDEDVPHGHHVGDSGNQSCHPGQSHDQSEPHVQSELLLGRGRIARSRCAHRRAADHARRVDEQCEVDGQNCGQRCGKVDEEGFTLAEPTDALTELRMVLNRHPSLDVDVLDD